MWSKERVKHSIEMRRKIKGETEREKQKERDIETNVYYTERTKQKKKAMKEEREKEINTVMLRGLFRLETTSAKPT